MISRGESNYIKTLSNKKQRDIEGLFVVEGQKCVGELIESHWPIKKIYATKQYYNFDSLKNVVEVSDIEMQKISNLNTPSQVLALAHTKPNSPIINNLNNKGLVILLDEIQDPGNFGTIIRLADWYNVSTIICSPNCVDFYNSKVIQSTMGSFTRVEVYYQNLEHTIASSNLPVFGAVLNGTDITSVNITNSKDFFLLIGNEGKGIAANLLPFINNSITIKKFGKAESLNAAIATGIILSHFIK
jgi:RNA methyltransferase, TrmH family